MRFFFSGIGPRWHDLFDDYDVKNALVSFDTPRTADQVADRFGKRPNTVFLLDSGAYSVWRSGHAVDLKEYIEFACGFIGKHKGKLSRIHIANLDVIPGVHGIPPSASDVAEAARQGWDNMLQMEKAGITPIHIFHQGEDFLWLEKLAARHRYIGISPNNDFSTKAKTAWLRQVFAQIRAKNMAHGFGISSRVLMRSFPWYSVDSVSWREPQMRGHSVFHVGRETFDSRGGPFGLSNKNKIHIDYVISSNIRGVMKLERDCTNLWARRGVVWPEDKEG